MINEEDLKQMLVLAETNHETATDPLDIAYWQGRKDALRTLLAETLNNDGYIRQIQSSVFHMQKEQREFEPAPASEITSVNQCIECAQSYFHKPGCRHGLGLSLAQFLERRESIEAWLSAKGEQ